MREVAHVRDEINASAKRKLLNKLKEVKGELHQKPKKQPKPNTKYMEITMDDVVEKLKLLENVTLKISQKFDNYIDDNSGTISKMEERI